MLLSSDAVVVAVANAIAFVVIVVSVIDYEDSNYYYQSIIAGYIIG